MVKISLPCIYAKIYFVLVNGNFTLWTGWSVCSKSCGFGIRTRYRNCTNPPPLFGGSDCLGELHQVKECENATVCPGRDFEIMNSKVGPAILGRQLLLAKVVHIHVHVHINFPSKCNEGAFTLRYVKQRRLVANVIHQ